MKIEPREITKELKESYLDYAMSVIISRALPDVRDGLKPVQRRILWAMWDGGITSGAKSRKSAYVVGECFARDTLINTSQGLIPIQDIKMDDYVYTQTGLKKVRRLYIMPPRPLLKVSLANGFNNIVTPSQRFKVLNPNLTFSWKEARELTTNDYLVLRSAYPEIKTPLYLGRFVGKKIYLNEEIAYLLGLFISDGWITGDYSKKKNSRIGFVAENRQVLKKIQVILNKEFAHSSNIEVKKYQYPTKEGELRDRKIYILRINNQALNGFISSKFNLVGKKALTKEIPREILQSSPAVIFAFISGLIEGDGFVSKRRKVINYTSTSEKLIDQLMLLLFSQGISCYKYRWSSGQKGHRLLNGRIIRHTHTPFALEITGQNALKLAARIVLADETKNAKLKRLIQQKTAGQERGGFHNCDIVPYAGTVLFQELSEAHLGAGWYQDFGGQKFRRGVKYPGGAKIRYSSNLQKKPLRTTQIVEWGIKEKLERIHSPFFAFVEQVLNHNLYFQRVASIKEQPPVTTYDLEIADEHEFLANGIVSHNCMGKYHPHGDMAIYDALARMAQDFSLRYQLIQGTGNWGSIEGDSPAAQRYTECKLSKIAEELLLDIEKGTVDWQSNYDATREEPKYLPAKLPNMLLNGASGIAVGMATNIPPHNLGEVVDATLYLIDNPKAETSALLNFIKGPDFPTGGVIYDRQAIAQAYSTGRGRIMSRGTAEIKDNLIEITSIPYQVNAADLVVKIAQLVTEKKIEGVRDVRNEIGKEGVRIVIEIKNDAAPQKVLNYLYQHTDLQKDFHLNMLALVEGLQPELLSLKDVLSYYLEHRQKVVRRRAEFELRRAKEREHILLGLAKALSIIDEVIRTIKRAADREDAFKKLIKNFEFSEIQANAILEMRLQTLAALERQKIEDELKAKQQLIAELQILLKSPAKILQVIKDELREIRGKYGDQRKTRVFSSGIKEFKEEDLIPEEEVIITFSHGGNIKRVPPTNFRSQHRGGKGLIGSEVAEEDFLDAFLAANTHDNILFFTDRGRVFQTKVWEIPVGTRTSKGKAVHNFLEIPLTEKISAIVAYAPAEASADYLVMLTEGGIIKKTSLSDLQNVRRTGIIAINLRKNDLLKWVRLSSGSDEIIITTKDGQSIRFKESQVRPMGRTASGVQAIRLKKADLASSLNVVSKNQKNTRLLVVTENGYGKQTPLGQYRVQKRGGSGIKTVQVTAKTGQLMSVHVIDEEEEIFVLSSKGQVIRTKIAQIRVAGRATQGVKVMTLEPGDKIVGAICL